MSDNTSLGDRMKKYEDVPRIYLSPRMPLIIRCDGRSFHTYTKGFDKPTDMLIMTAMTEAGKALMNEIQGAKLVYIQSDEISVLVNDYERFDTGAWFDKNLQKMVSVSASTATAYFNKYMWSKGVGKTGTFDSRAFVIPREETCNYFLWRYQDCTRNSVSSLAQSMFSAKKLHGVKTDGLKQMIRDGGKDWDACPGHQKYGIYIKSDGSILSDVFENIKPIIDDCLVQKEM